MFEQNRDVVRNHLLGAARSFMGMNWTQVARPDLEADLNFASLEQEFRAIAEMSRQLLALDLSVVPHDLLNTAYNVAGRLQEQVGRMLNFSLRQLAEQRSDPKSAREQVVRDFYDQYRAFVSALPPVFAYAAASVSSDVYARTQAELADARTQVSAAVTDARAQLEDLKKLTQLSKEEVQKAGVTRHANFFRIEAQRHEKASDWWLGAVIVLSASLAGLAFLNLSLVLDTPPPPTTAAALSQIAAKLLLFSVVASATIWCGRVYRSHKHNSVVNKHRENALSSFETFAASTDNPDTRNVVLVQATQSIFSPQHSGFSPTDSDPTMSSPLLELARTSVGDKS